MVFSSRISGVRRRRLGARCVFIEENGVFGGEFLPKGFLRGQGTGYRGRKAEVRRRKAEGGRFFGAGFRFVHDLAVEGVRRGWGIGGRVFCSTNIKNSTF
jgi:hypothetical protein